jgi:hypothetical protein
MDTRNLVIISCGRNSYHTNWKLQDTTFDTALIQYDNKETFDLTDEWSKSAKYKAYGSGPKFLLSYSLLKLVPAILQEYEYYCIMDDDIEVSPKEMDDLFKYGKDNNFELFQPSISLNCNWEALKPVQDSNHRILNTVENMLPILSNDLMNYTYKTLMPEMLHGYGWGFEWCWKDYLAKNGKGDKIAVVDKISVKHLRPGDVTGAERMYGLFGSPFEEMHNTLHKFNVIHDGIRNI